MSKREVIDRIVRLNASADPGFLSAFEDRDLVDYLDRLQAVAAPPSPGGVRAARPPRREAPEAPVAVLDAPEPADLAAVSV